MDTAYFSLSFPTAHDRLLKLDEEAFLADDYTQTRSKAAEDELALPKQWVAEVTYSGLPFWASESF